MPTRGKIAVRKQPPRPGAFDAHGLTHRGMVRDHNEDAWAIDLDAGIAIVADGVGGHGGGAAASTAATRLLGTYVRRVYQLARRHAPAVLSDSNFLEQVMSRAIAFAHSSISTQNGVSRSKASRKGSTIVGLWAPLGIGSPAVVFHVGDSRLYLLRHGKLQQMTRDHSAYEQWRAAGKIGVPPSKKYILQALGLSDNVVPTVQSIVPASADRILLCTDGLTGAVDDGELSSIIARNEDLPVLCDQLIARGLAQDASDNLTAVLCKFGIQRT